MGNSRTDLKNILTSNFELCEIFHYAQCRIKSYKDIDIDSFIDREVEFQLRPPEKNEPDLAKFYESTRETKFFQRSIMRYWIEQILLSIYRDIENELTNTTDEFYSRVYRRP